MERVEQTEVRKNQEREDRNPTEGGGDYPELRGRHEVVLQIPSLEEILQISVPQRHPHQRGDVPHEESGKCDQEGDGGQDPVAGHNRREQHHQLQLRQGARHCITNVAHAVHIPQAQPPCDSQQGQPSRQCVAHLVQVAAEAEADIKFELVLSAHGPKSAEELAEEVVDMELRETDEGPCGGPEVAPGVQLNRDNREEDKHQHAAERLQGMGNVQP
mmetsp:Transcript_37674/g.104898  ORF Transcript_37674/g.104898 Transcript_37674/m.104898 type:complete len:216 (-) Transcript_37674:127-774(-)